MVFFCSVLFYYLVPSSFCCAAFRLFFSIFSLDPSRYNFISRAIYTYKYEYKTDCPLSPSIHDVLTKKGFFSDSILLPIFFSTSPCIIINIYIHIYINRDDPDATTLFHTSLSLQCTLMGNKKKVEIWWWWWLWQKEWSLFLSVFISASVSLSLRSTRWWQIWLAAQQHIYPTKTHKKRHWLAFICVCVCVFALRLLKLLLLLR